MAFSWPLAVLSHFRHHFEPFRAVSTAKSSSSSSWAGGSTSIADPSSGSGGLEDMRGAGDTFIITFIKTRLIIRIRVRVSGRVCIWIHIRVLFNNKWVQFRWQDNLSLPYTIVKSSGISMQYFKCWHFNSPVFPKGHAAIGQGGNAPHYPSLETDARGPQQITHWPLPLPPPILYNM